MPTEAAQAVGGTLGAGSTLEYHTCFVFFLNKEVTKAILKIAVSF